MKAKYTLQAESREKLGRGAARELRRTGRIPAVLYSSKIEPKSFSLSENEFLREYNKGGLRSKLVELNVENNKFYALAREIQTHPVSDKVEHIDFLQVDAETRIPVAVPLKLVNAEKCPGVKRGGSINVVRHFVRLVCLPDNIPSSLDVDVSEAMIGDSIHISEITLPEGVTPMVEDRDFTIVTIAGRLAKEEETTTEEVAADEVPVEGEEAAEGEVGAEAAAE